MKITGKRQAEKSTPTASEKPFVTYRLQTQERLAYQIADFIMHTLKPRGVAVVLEVSHSCMTIQGIKKPGSAMVTSALRGIFQKRSKKPE